jgi:putative hydrolase of the HAD superfamily
MIETAVELAGESLSKSMIEGILAAGRALLAHPVQLFDGVEDTLRTLAKMAPLVVVTKGDLLHQESKLAASGLGDLFSGIEIVSDKKVDTFRALFARLAVAPQEAVMAGDSMRSDILPALEAGAWAAFIPQEGGWSHESATAPSDRARFTQIESLADLPEWIRAIG